MKSPIGNSRIKCLKEYESDSTETTIVTNVLDQ